VPLDPKSAGSLIFVIFQQINAFVLAAHFISDSRRSRAAEKNRILGELPEESLWSKVKNIAKAVKKFIAGTVSYIFIDIVDMEQAVKDLTKQDPVMFLADYGHKFMFAGSALIGVGLAATVAPGLNLAIFSLAGMCYTAGFTLAYYLPAIPIIFWVLGIVGWLIMVLEAVVAAPLWAASHVLPEGEGFAGPPARQGYMLLLALLIRPVLMVIGLQPDITIGLVQPLSGELDAVIPLAGNDDVFHHEPVFGQEPGAGKQPASGEKRWHGACFLRPPIQLDIVLVWLFCNFFCTHYFRSLVYFLKSTRL